MQFLRMAYSWLSVPERHHGTRPTLGSPGALIRCMGETTEVILRPDRKASAFGSTSARGSVSSKGTAARAGPKANRAALDQRSVRLIERTTAPAALVMSSRQPVHSCTIDGSSAFNSAMALTASIRA